MRHKRNIAGPDAVSGRLGHAQHETDNMTVGSVGGDIETEGVGDISRRKISRDIAERLGVIGNSDIGIGCRKRRHQIISHLRADILEFHPEGDTFAVIDHAVAVSASDVVDGIVLIHQIRAVRGDGWNGDDIGSLIKGCHRQGDILAHRQSPDDRDTGVAGRVGIGATEHCSIGIKRAQGALDADRFHGEFGQREKDGIVMIDRHRRRSIGPDLNRRIAEYGPGVIFFDSGGTVEVHHLAGAVET